MSVPPLFTAPATQYLRQLHEAEKSERAMAAKLKGDGWIYNSSLHLWQHPDKPGWSIEP